MAKMSRAQKKEIKTKVADLTQQLHDLGIPFVLVTEDMLENRMQVCVKLQNEHTFTPPSTDEALPCLTEDGEITASFRHYMDNAIDLSASAISSILEAWLDGMIAQEGADQAGLVASTMNVISQVAMRDFDVQGMYIPSSVFNAGQAIMETFNADFGDEHGIHLEMGGKKPPVS